MNRVSVLRDIVENYNYFRVETDIDEAIINISKLYQVCNNNEEYLFEYNLINMGMYKGAEIFLKIHGEIQGHRLLLVPNIRGTLYLSDDIEPAYAYQYKKTT